MVCRPPSLCPEAVSIPQNPLGPLTDFSPFSLGMWESLVYAEPVPESLLRVVTHMMRISKLPDLNPALICLHNLALLCGPPGSGKTTLAKALAQKLAIRLAHVYSAAKLVTINSPSLLSSYFGESSKLVAKLFDTIWNMSSDDSLLTVVVIDEVESIASSRSQASQSNECGDAIRSTNEVLRGMDKLRSRPNVLFICTSNLKSRLDTAFIDRCGIKQDIGSPSTACAYEILQTMINELIRNDLVLYDGADQHTNSPASSSSSFTETHSYMPSLSHTNIHFSNSPECAPRQLYKLARRAEGLSGRTLRRLPILALTKYTDDEPCAMQDLLAALKKVIAEEKASQTEEYDSSSDPAKVSRDRDRERGAEIEIGDADGGEDGISHTGSVSGSENWMFSMDSVRDGIRGMGIGVGQV
ncbi:AAA-domain-containing protein [Lophiostoma macrostomum CBS 122681]|uniref:AAA-domain-containing protein n=1 Tax=Lophiostoma macrostomum CBS 122681 TaxID=1314788 RepID=A0A6A6T5L7_9PLEO|nr:AAA-domain-containing protein [Lophiostoma macrostomum CBS 122681]